MISTSVGPYLKEPILDRSTYDTEISEYYLHMSLETHRGQCQNLVATYHLRALENLVRHILRCRSTVRDVVLDAKVVVRSTWIVARGQQDTTVCLVLPDDVRGCRCREDSILANDEFPNAIRRPDLKDRLYGLWREEPPIATDD